MNLIVRHGSTERELTIRATDTGHEVRIGDRTYVVEAARTGSTTRSLLIDGRQIELGVRTLGNGRFLVDTGESALSLEVLDPLGRLAEVAHAGESEGGGCVAAYMPGRVVTVLVAEGDSVEAGQGIVVLEAMKMENEIQADRSGVVTRILVEPGQPVDGGDPLFEIG